MGGSHQNLSYQFDYKFQGKEESGFAGLTDFGARYLDKAAVVWTSFDPLAEKYYNIAPNAFVMGNPLKYIDPNGKEIDVAELLKSKQHAEAFVFFAATKAGKAFLDQYAAKDQKLEYNGKVFYQAKDAGFYDIKGINLKYSINTAQNKSESYTKSSFNGKLMDVNISVAQDGYGSENKQFNLIKGIMHESLLHANSTANDILDNRVPSDNSNLPKEFQGYGEHSDHYLVSSEYYRNSKSEFGRSFPIDGFAIMKQASKQLQLNYTDIKIKSIMWDFKGSLIKVNPQTGKIMFNVK